MKAKNTSNPESAAPPMDAPEIPASVEVPACSRVEALENIDLNVVDGNAGTYAQNILQYAVKKEAVHRKYTQRKTKGAKAWHRFSKAVVGTRLTGGVMFRECHTRCNDEVLEVRREIDQRKKDGKTERVRNKATRETEKERYKQKESY